MKAGKNEGAGFSLPELGRRVPLCSPFTHRSMRVGLLKTAPPFSRGHTYHSLNAGGSISC